MQLDDKLQQGLAQIGLDLPQDVHVQLLEFIALVAKWNKAYNLTAILEPEQMLVKHLLDSLSVHAYLQKTRYMDVGCGPGFPSIPLALAYPDKQFDLVEPNQKKVSFIEVACMKLKLKNVRAHAKRVQDVQFETLFDGIVSRAFTQLGELYTLCHGLVKPSGEIFAMKGDVTQEELEGLPEHVSVNVHPLEVPFLEAKRHLVVIGELVREKNNSNQ